MENTHSMPRRAAASFSGPPARLSAMATMTVSSTSGYHAFWYSKNHPPGRVPGRTFAIQSPVQRTSFCSSHCVARSRSGSISAVRPQSVSAYAAMPVSHTGLKHGWMWMHGPSLASSSSMKNASRSFSARCTSGSARFTPSAWNTTWM